VITNNAEGKPKENPAASWVFLVTASGPVSKEEFFFFSFFIVPYQGECANPINDSN
jgi:hypothetical protein